MTIDANTLALLTLGVMLGVHLISTVWWAATVTKRVEHIERWIANNEHTAERLASLEQRIENIGSGVFRIEQFIRQKF